MKHIKLFESSGYNEIDGESYVSLQRNAISFSQREVESINTLIEKNSMYVRFRAPADYLKHITYLRYRSKINPSEIYIHCLKDEWYLLEVYLVDSFSKKQLPTSLLFKCDQMDGLLACLKEVVK